MTLDWGGVALIVGTAGALYAVKQMAADNKENLTLLVQQNREDHKELFHAIGGERETRAQADASIRADYVRRDECDRRMAQRRSGKDRRQGHCEEAD